MPVKSISELYDDFKAQVQSEDDTLTDWNDGSLLDIIDGVISTAVSEVQRIALDQFAKTFVETANGPEVTEGTDDLQTLLVDHFGDEFARPAATPAQGTVTFSRASSGAGNCTIPAGTVVKTSVNAAGIAQRFATETEVVMTSLSINASVSAIVDGVDGNVEIAEINEIESNLTDSTIVVTNAAAMAGGTDEATDSEYREFARNLLVSVRGATLASVEATAKTVAGVETAVGQEFSQRVIEYNEAAAATVGSSFLISHNILYIADANGTANDALILAVETAIEPIRAAGIKIDVLGATAVVVNVTCAITLNGSGPNYAELSADPQDILDDIELFMQDLAIGADFIRADVVTYIMSLWGPSGSNDITAISISVPVGDVTAAANEKIIPGTIGVA
jgi:hypothetical protein